MPKVTDLFVELAERAASAVRDGTDPEYVGGFASHAQDQIQAYLGCPGKDVAISKTHLRALHLFFNVLNEALDPRCGTKLQLQLKRKPGRPRVSRRDRIRREEAALLVHEYLGSGLAPNQPEAIKMALREMERRSRSERLSERILERTVQHERRLMGI